MTRYEPCRHCAELEAEIRELRGLLAERAADDRAYLTWSMGGGMMETVFAGANLRDGLQADTDDD